MNAFGDDESLADAEAGDEPIVELLAEPDSVSALQTEYLGWMLDLWGKGAPRPGRRAAIGSYRVSALAGKLALVTGASGTIGAAVARRLAHDGANVLAHYGTNRDGADAVVRAIIAAAGEAEVIGSDLSEPNGAAALIAQLDGAFGGRFAGRLDVLVNNAGTFTSGSIEETTDDDFDRLFAINVRAPFQLAREAARRMTALGWAESSTSAPSSDKPRPRPG